VAEEQKQQASHLELGRRGERFALEYLKHRAGYRIVATNFALPIGRNIRGAPVIGELDIIAYDGEVLAFIEVKTRTSEDLVAAEAAVDRSKQRTLARTARAYRALMKLGDAAYRYDVVTVILQNASPTITLSKGFFSERNIERKSVNPFYDR
jgi:putative endonuclease